MSPMPPQALLVRARRAPLVLAGLLVATTLLVACGRPGPAPIRLPDAPPWWIAGVPMSHIALTQVIAGDPDAPPPAEPPLPIRPGIRLQEGRLRLLRSYLAILARGGPDTNPEVFPTDRDALAYLLDAHVGWALLLGQEPTLAHADVVTIRRTPFPLEGRTTTLEGLELEIVRRWPTEPRTVLVLNPGWKGGPPLPASAIEAHSLAWQLAEHAKLCGRAPGFWSFDEKARSVSVSAYTAFMPDLPAEPGRRARRLLDLVPPPPELATAVLATCGDVLQRCTITFTPVDEGR